MLAEFTDANLTINLAKSEFGHVEVTFLEHTISSGWVKPHGAKIQSINGYLPPSNWQELMRFLSIVGYY